MQLLFYIDIRRIEPMEALELYCQSFPPPEKANAFFLELVNGVIREHEQIDTTIERFSNNWKLSRMSCVDRNILRIAVFEMLNCGNIPDKVSINEAINIGKKYGSEESGAFINGILDGIRIFLEKNKEQQHSNITGTKVNKFRKGGKDGIKKSSIG